MLSLQFKVTPLVLRLDAVTTVRQILNMFANTFYNSKYRLDMNVDADIEGVQVSRTSYILRILWACP